MNSMFNSLQIQSDCSVLGALFRFFCVQDWQAKTVLRASCWIPWSMSLCHLVSLKGLNYRITHQFTRVGRTGSVLIHEDRGSWVPCKIPVEHPEAPHMCPTLARSKHLSIRQSPGWCKLWGAVQPWHRPRGASCLKIGFCQSVASPDSWRRGWLDCPCCTHGQWAS